MMIIAYSSLYKYIYMGIDICIYIACRAVYMPSYLSPTIFDLLHSHFYFKSYYSIKVLLFFVFKSKQNVSQNQATRLGVGVRHNNIKQMLCAQNAKSNEQNPIIKQLLQLPLSAAGPLARCPDPCAMCTTPPFRDQDGRSTLLPQLRKEQKGGATASTCLAQLLSECGTHFAAEARAPPLSGFRAHCYSRNIYFVRTLRPCRSGRTCCSTIAPRYTEIYWSELL